jgi:glycine/serine hydroxymethyltransferase
MKKKEMQQLAKWIIRAVEQRDNKAELKKIQKEVIEMCRGFAVPGL